MRSFMSISSQAQHPRLPQPSGEPRQTVARMLATRRSAGNQVALRAQQDRARHVPGAADFAPHAVGPVPHLDTIQRSFGREHDLSSVRAQVGGSVVWWNAALGASASTRGDRMTFSTEPSLEEAAHEAAHVVQQRQGAHPPGGRSRAGDPWELQADAIAARVTRGEPVADLLGRSMPRASVANPPIQTRLIAHGSAADVASFFAIAETASGLDLDRDPTTDVVTAVGSLVAGPTSPAFAATLTNIINDPLQNAEAQFGTHQTAPVPGGGVGGVFVGAFPNAAPTIQIIDMDDVDAVEAGASGRGVAFLAHELQENFTAHALPVGPGSFGAAHAAGNVAEAAVATDLVGPGTELLEYLVPNPAGGTSFIEDYENYFVVVDFAAAPAPPLTSAPPDNVVTGARQVPQTTIATFTIDGFPTGSDVVPVAPGTIALIGVLLAVNPTAALHVEGFTDDVGSAASNLDLGRKRAIQGRALFAPAFLNRVAAIGRGEISFVAPNNSEANRARNRRIVLTVVRP